MFLPAFFFIVGFAYDTLTLDRIDHWFGITQLAVFLTIVCVFLLMMAREQVHPFAFTGIPAQIWQYREHIVHFLFGGLLSAFTIFFFKSASFFASFVFLILMAALLVANEFPFFQKRGLYIKFGLFALSLLSYFSYIVPILLGYVGLGPFVLAIVVTVLVLAGIYFLLTKISLENRLKQFLYPSAAVVGLFLLLYILKLTPPVPISAKFMAVYHNVEKQNGKYIGYFEKPWWRFWHNGDELFVAQAGDKIYCFVRLFSPTAFQDRVHFHWLFYDQKQGWVSSDKIPVEIVGGREEGFRGFAYKQNYQPGEWQVRLETTDGREIARLYLDVESSPVINPRRFRTHVH